MGVIGNRMLGFGIAVAVGATVLSTKTHSRIASAETQEVGRDYSNEPAGFERVAELRFNEHGEPGWNDLSKDPEFALESTLDYVPEESSARPPGSPGTGQDDSIGVAKFFPHLSAGTAPISLSMTPDAAVNSRGVEELFWAHWFQASSNHQLTATGVNKIGFVELGSPDSRNGASAIYWALTGVEKSQSFSYAIFTQGTADEGRRFTCSGGKIVRAGQWQKMEHYARLNSVSAAGNANADGVFRVWVDGLLCLNVEDVRFRGTEARYVGPEAVFSRVKWEPTYSSPSPPDTSYQFMSDLIVSVPRER